MSLFPLIHGMTVMAKYSTMAINCQEGFMVHRESVWSFNRLTNIIPETYIPSDNWSLETESV